MIRAVLIVALLGLAPGIFAESGFGYSNLAQFDTVDPVLTLVSPVGGEIWYIGEEYDIEWSAVDTNYAINSTFLYYSTDGGANFDVITQYLPISGTYGWEIPAEPSVSGVVRVRASDTFGNQGQDENGACFELRYMDLKPPDNLAISIADDTDAQLDWDAVTETVNEVPLNADGYYIFHNESPDEEDFSYLDTVDTNSFTHANAANLYPRSFYYIVAYTDEDGKTAAVLQAIREHGRPGAQPLTLRRFRQLVSGKGGN